VSVFEGGGSLRSPIKGASGRRPPTTVGWQKTRIALSCGIKISPIGQGRVIHEAGEAEASGPGPR